MPKARPGLGRAFLFGFTKEFSVGLVMNGPYGDRIRPRPVIVGRAEPDVAIRFSYMLSGRERIPTPATRSRVRNDTAESFVRVRAAGGHKALYGTGRTISYSSASTRAARKLIMVRLCSAKTLSFPDAPCRSEVVKRPPRPEKRKSGNKVPERQGKTSQKCLTFREKPV